MTIERKRVGARMSPNRYRLASYNQKDIEDAHVIRAFPVEWIRRAV